MLTTGSAAEHLAPGLREIIGTRLGGRETFYSQMYNVQTTSRNYEDYLAATTLPIATLKPEGVDIQSADPKEGTTMRVSPKVYAMGLEISEEMWDDDLYQGDGSMIRESANGLADSFAERVELQAHLPFGAQGFAMGTDTWPVLPSGTGVSFFDTAHTPVAGSQGVTQSNRPTTNSDLTLTTLRTAQIAFRRYKDDMGKKIPGIAQPVELWVPPELEYTAKELTGSSNRPDTANLVENVTKGMLTVKVNPYLDDTDAWLLKAQKHYAYFLWRWRPRMDSFDDRRARVAVHVIYGRFSHAPAHWLGWYGSPGAD